MLFLAASAARLGVGALIATLYGLLGVAIGVAAVVYIFFGKWAKLRGAFVVAVVVGVLLFLSWLTGICEPGAPKSLYTLPLDPIDVMAIGGLAMALMLVSLSAFRSLGAFLVIAPMIVLVALGEWFLFNHFVVPYYSQCAQSIG